MFESYHEKYRVHLGTPGNVLFGSKRKSVTRFSRPFSEIRENCAEKLLILSTRRRLKDQSFPWSLVANFRVPMHQKHHEETPSNGVSIISALKNCIDAQPMALCKTKLM